MPSKIVVDALNPLIEVYVAKKIIEGRRKRYDTFEICLTLPNNTVIAISACNYNLTGICNRATTTPGDIRIDYHV